MELCRNKLMEFEQEWHSQSDSDSSNLASGRLAQYSWLRYGHPFLQFDWNLFGFRVHCRVLERQEVCDYSDPDFRPTGYSNGNRYTTAICH